MELFKALVLGIIQGATEFLPVSSSGHLVIVPAALKWEPPPLVFDTTVHLATLAAVIIFFRHDLGKILAAWWRELWCGHPLQTMEARLGWWVIIGTVPGVIAGVLLEEMFASFFGSPRTAGIFFLVTAALLLTAEALGRRRRTLQEMGFFDAVLIGVGQAAAIAPGLSRSGTTIGVGMFLGLTRESAARFSFILAIPIITGAAVVQIAPLLKETNTVAYIPELATGFVAAGISGYLAIRSLLAYVRRKALYPFAAYCTVVGILSLIFL